MNIVSEYNEINWINMYNGQICPFFQFTHLPWLAQPLANSCHWCYYAVINWILTLTQAWGFCFQISYIWPSIWMQSSALFCEYQTGKGIRISRSWGSQSRYVPQHKSPFHFLHWAVIWFHWKSRDPCLLWSIIYKSWQAQWTNTSSLIIYAVSANFRFL